MTQGHYSEPVAIAMFLAAVGLSIGVFAFSWIYYSEVGEDRILLRIVYGLGWAVAAFIVGSILFDGFELAGHVYSNGVRQDPNAFLFGY